jgi:cell division topological specificity factor
MNFGFFRRRGPAAVARERLQVLLAHERNFRGTSPDLVAVLRDEILAVIAKHVTMEPNNVQIKMDRGDSVTILKIDVEISTSSCAAVVPPEARKSTRVGSKASARLCKSSR